MLPELDSMRISIHSTIPSSDSFIKLCRKYPVYNSKNHLMTNMIKDNLKDIC